MVIISSLPKLDAFQIAEGLHKRNLFTHLYTGYAHQKKRYINRFIRRIDTESIPPDLIDDLWPLQVAYKFHTSSIYNELFDLTVARRINKRHDYKAVLAWSGMSEHTIKAAKRKNKFTVVARGSCHIEMQNDILTNEFLKYGQTFKMDKRLMRKELAEYELADSIYVCSSFVKKSFIDRGFPESKIFLNPIPVPTLFKPVVADKPKSKFTILFLGKLTIQKGVRYLFDALDLLSNSTTDFEAWFVGASDPVVWQEFTARKKSNWKYLGFIPQERLPTIISQADVGVFPSVQDGFAQVVPQQLSCGLPVITTFNTGSSDFIRDGYNGFVVPACSAEMLALRLTQVFNDSSLLQTMKLNALKINEADLSRETVMNKFEAFFRSHF